jgi:hypothetical protein
MRRLLAAISMLCLFGVTPAFAYGSFDPSSAWSAPQWASYQRWKPYTGYEPYRHRRYTHAYQRPRHAHRGRHVAHVVGIRTSGSLPGPCYLARRQGGPCGCVAEGIIFGRYDHVLNGMNLWLANAWLGFPRATPGPGTAAVWPGRHVEAVVANNGDGTVTTSGPYGQRRVRISSVVFVDPHGGYAGHREARRRYAANAHRGWRRWRRHYAGA